MAQSVIQRIYADIGRDVHRLPAAVSRHFTGPFLDQLPYINASRPPESYTRGTLVRFRAMIQDTSVQNEVYLARFDDQCGGWGIQPTRDDYGWDAIDPNCLATASVFWAVSVPGETPWRTAETSQSDATRFPAHCSSQPHKFPFPGAPHIGVRVKIYDDADVEKLRSTDVATFVGIISSEILNIEEDFSPEVPVLHVLSYQLDSQTPTLTDIDPGIRADLLDWISNEALGGDNDAAEWVLLQLASKIHIRSTPLLPPSLTLSRIPQPSYPELPPTLSHLLEELLPQYLFIPLSLGLLNEIPFLPESKEENLHSGYLQLPLNTTLLLTESAIQEGKLLERGIANIRAVQDVIDSQTLDYIFPFSSGFTFNTDLSIVVLSEGRKSTFFKTSINLPLQCSSTPHDLYKSKDKITFPPVEKMSLYRSYIANCRALSKKVQVTEVTSKYIQDDFVRLRQQDMSMTQDELVHLMKVARLLAASQLQDEVTTDVWEKAKELDDRRKARQCNA